MTPSPRDPDSPPIPPVPEQEARVERSRFIIHVCPACGFYDADPILRRMPGTKHGPKRCFPCGKRAEAAVDFSRYAPSFHAHYRSEARESAPILEPVEMAVVAQARAELLAEVEELLHSPEATWIVEKARRDGCPEYAADRLADWLAGEFGGPFGGDGRPG